MTVTDWGVSSSVKLGDSFRIDGGVHRAPTLGGSQHSRA